MENGLKLYVWNDRFQCDWSCGVAFALAKNKAQAKRLIMKDSPYVTWDDLSDEPEVYSVPYGYSVSGGG